MRSALPWNRQSQGFAPLTLAPSTMINPVPPHLGQTLPVDIGSIISQTRASKAGFRMAEIRGGNGRCESPEAGKSQVDSNHTSPFHVTNVYEAFRIQSVSMVLPESSTSGHGGCKRSPQKMF